ncbi:glucose-6-phosphate dehydrogenase [candidate division KSB1 bacterium]|nr:glucose-6-phosphate dehydrogenase [candidate division KSB1 bacterium]
MNSNPLREGMRLKRIAPSHILIILGVTGDLTRRKLIPSLYQLYRRRLLPTDLSIVGFARREKSDEQFRNEMAEELLQLHAPEKDVLRFVAMLHYHRGDFADPNAYRALRERLESMDGGEGERQPLLFYLATPPSAYGTIIDHLGAAGFSDESMGWRRIVVEKPFGVDLSSAQQLNARVLKVFREKQIYRIDHYLGKETVQNLLVFRFANGIFEPIWNRRYIDHVQITVAETLGIEGRAAFFEQTGILRDIVQNHVFQLLCLVAMEPPAAVDADAVRDEKVKVLRALQTIAAADVEKAVVRAQYSAGSLWNETLPGYLQEEGVAPDSTTETFVAMRLFLNNWRWAGVPFYLRTGKRLPKKVTEIAIFFKDAPLQFFPEEMRKDVVSNVLALNIQPNEGISLSFDSKVPGYDRAVRPVTMDFRYGAGFGEELPDAYERLLLDAMVGDSTLFIRADENETAWKILQPVLENWMNQNGTLPHYPVGTWGAAEAQALFPSGRRWRRL